MKAAERVLEKLLAESREKDRESQAKMKEADAAKKEKQKKQLLLEQLERDLQKCRDNRINGSQLVFDSYCV